MTSPATFNLIDEPWIRVRTLTGAVQERSLWATLAEANELRGLAGEIPTQDAAILRLLLAVILGATRPRFPRSDRENLELFEAWWDDTQLPMDIVGPYLDGVHQRFDLLHPQTPFYQVAGLTTPSGKKTGLGKLIADLPANLPFFTTRGGRELESLSLSEAARWLVHCQAFDPSGIKTGAVGDVRVKGGKGYSFGYPAWAGNLGLVTAEGRTLAETLLLNTPWFVSGPDDLPVWDRPQLGPGADAGHPAPRGPADLFTWPSRRLRLFLTDDRVTDVQISNGDRLGPQNLHAFEPMTAWRYSKAQSKAGTKVLMPVTHDPTRRIWQGLGPLVQPSFGPNEGQPARVIGWLAQLQEEEIVPGGHIVDLRTVGLEYGTQNSVITGATDDRLTASVAALTDPVLVQAAVDAASQASQGVIALANLAGNLDRAAGGEGNAREHTFEVGYALLDSPFRAWIRTLDHPEHVPDHRNAWAVTASALLRKAGDALVGDAGRAALVGRPVRRDRTGQAELLDAGLALLWFRTSLAKTFPQAKPHSDEVI
ncbi:MAG: type I-E CRISPR-associated protein Cse1/CasA [Acidobacteriota bacterium]|nr:type I-E CRISPR-associated protein Cse1/CasA [Acidobacteriota bacterium]